MILRRGSLKINAQMSHLPEGWGGGGGGVWKSKFEWGIPKNQCKIDPFWVGHFSFGGVGVVEGSETLKNRKCPWDINFEISVSEADCGV